MILKLLLFTRILIRPDVELRHVKGCLSLVQRAQHVQFQQTQFGYLSPTPRKGKN